MAYAAEYELDVLFINCQEAVTIKKTLVETNNPQPITDTPVITDNYMVMGIDTSSVTQKISKAIDMHFFGSKTMYTSHNYHLLKTR